MTRGDRIGLSHRVFCCLGQLACRTYHVIPPLSKKEQAGETEKGGEEGERESAVEWHSEWGYPAGEQQQRE